MSANAQASQIIVHPNLNLEGSTAEFTFSAWITRINSTTGLRFLVATFVTLSSADFILTKLLLQCSSGQIYESNPLADMVLAHAGWFGLAIFKIAIVGLVSGLILYIEQRKPIVAQRLAAFACLSTSGVVAYSVCLGFFCV